MAIGIDSFSYHRFFGEFGPYETRTDVRWTTDDFLDRAAELGVDVVALQTIYLPSLTRGVIDGLRHSLDARGLRPVLCWGHPFGLNGGCDLYLAADLRSMLPCVPLLGCELVRFVTGHARTFAESTGERIDRLTPLIRECCHVAADLGLTLALENHCDFRMVDLVHLINAVDAPNLGICFDGVNAVRVGDDLLTAASLAAPYTRMIHLRNWVPLPGTSDRVDGFWPSRPLDDGVLDIGSLLRLFAAAGYNGDYFVEIAYLHPDYSNEDAYVASSVNYLRQHPAFCDPLSAASA